MFKDVARVFPVKMAQKVATWMSKTTQVVNRAADHGVLLGGHFGESKNGLGLTRALRTILIQTGCGSTAKRATGGHADSPGDLNPKKTIINSYGLVGATVLEPCNIDKLS